MLDNTKYQEIKEIKIGTSYRNWMEFLEEYHKAQYQAYYCFLFCFLLRNHKFVILGMFVLYIHVENICSELRETWFMILKFYRNGLKEIDLIKSWKFSILGFAR